MRFEVLCVILFVSVMEASYWSRRKLIIEKERQIAVGGDLILNAKEREASKIILAAKQEEYELGRKDASKFLASRNFIRAKSEIDNSKVFKLIRKLPKGGSLHSHLFASTSFDYVFDNLTYRENLYVCDIDGRLKLKFLPNKTSECELLTDKRKDESYNAWLRSQLFLEEAGDEGKNINDVWSHFRKIFTATYDLFSYKPVFEDYVYQFLKELYLDNVFYMEIRGPFVELYELNGKKCDAVEFVGVLWRTIQRFKRDHPKFLDAKFIYAQYRKIDNETLRENLALVRTIMRQYPDFIVGIDFVGFEEEAPLVNYVDELNKSGLQYFFHAGETNWYGADVDGNLIDAVLLRSRRIGHAYALPKHPELMRMVKKHDIAIEVSPISNQALKLVSDLRNHPASSFIADGFPVVICNDDPGNWGAEGLSYDWYLVFMAMTSRTAGLEVLKKFAMNSINYSAMRNADKEAAMRSWQEDWDKFVSDLVKDEKYEVLRRN